MIRVVGTREANDKNNFWRRRGFGRESLMF
jgi:hypothetical protein